MSLSKKLAYFLALAVITGSVWAQAALPARTVTLVTPYPPGGLADSTARQLGMRLSSLWKQAVVVDSRPGAAGNIGAVVVATAPADGHTLLFTIPEALSITKASGASVGFDPAADLVPVALVALSSTVLIVNGNSPIKSFAEFMAHAKANPGKVNFGSQGQGSSFHLALEQLKVLSGTDIVHVPYKGAAAALTDLMAGRIDAMIATTALAAPNVKAGKVRAIAVTSGERLPQFEGVPTVRDSGYPNFEYPVGLGIFVRAGTPAAVVEKLNADIRKVMHDPAFIELLGQSATTTTDLTAAAFQKRWAQETEGYRQLIQKSKIRFD